MTTFVSLSGDMGRLLATVPFVTGVGFSNTVLPDPRVDCSVTLLAIFEDNGSLPTGGCCGKGTWLFRVVDSADVVTGTIGLLADGVVFCKFALLTTAVTGWTDAVVFVAETVVTGEGALLTEREAAASTTEVAVLVTAVVPK